MRITTLIIILFSIINSYSQEKKEIIYKGPDGKLMTESEFIILKDGFKKIMDQKEKNGELKEVIKDSIVKNKIYKNFKLTFISSENVIKDERIELYFE